MHNGHFSAFSHRNPLGLTLDKSKINATCGQVTQMNSIHVTTAAFQVFYMYYFYLYALGKHFLSKATYMAFTFYQFLLSRRIEPMTLPLLLPCSVTPF